MWPDGGQMAMQRMKMTGSGKSSSRGSAKSAESKRTAAAQVERSREYLDNAMVHYLDFLSQVSLLTPAEEIRLTRDLWETSNPQRVREEARRQLIEANLRLVLNIAKQYRNMGIPFQDLISEGNIGLMTAIDKFDPRKGHRLSTYATWWIRQRILRYIISNQSIIRVPEHIIDKINKLRRETEKFRQKNHREPTVAELAEQSEMSEAEILRFSSAVPFIMSLESGFEHSDGDEVGEGGPSIGDRVGSEGDLFLKTVDRITVRTLLGVLDNKERDIICRRYGLTQEDEDSGGGLTHYDEGATLEQLANEYNVSRERIRQVEYEALRKMRRAYNGKLAQEFNKGNHSGR
jgi:RNA polymerase primary sigma factor